jgi:hypothetical protein
MSAGDQRCKQRRVPRWPLSAIVLLVVYVATYFVLSRTAYRAADAAHIEGFYFGEQNRPADFTIHRIGVCVFYPCLWVDYHIGSGRWPASEGMHGLH